MPSPTGHSPASQVSSSGDDAIDSLIFGYKWGGGAGSGIALTYSFPGASSVWSPADYPSGSEPDSGFAALSAAERADFARALDGWGDISGLSFNEVADNSGTVGDIRAAYTTHMMGQNAAGYAYYPAPFAIAGDVWLSRQEQDGLFSAHAPGTPAFSVFLHELGHALGLKHPHDDNPNLPAAQDNMFYTVMSYNVWSGTGGSAAFANYYPTTPMGYDLKAIQYLYGPDLAHNAGNTLYRYEGDEHYLETIWDAGGTDTIEYVSATGGLIDLNPGGWSELGLPVKITSSRQTTEVPHTVYAADAVSVGNEIINLIENAIGGTGADTLVGNSAANLLAGGGGDDELLGGNGNDKLNGDAGNDGIEGGSGKDKIDGSSGDDKLSGGAGKDRLTGGTGDDQFVFDAALDGGANLDKIIDFTPNVDTIRLDNAVFTGLSGGTLKAAVFAIGSGAGDAGDRIIYDSASGALFFDPDGTGGAAAVRFATLDAGLQLTALDFEII